MNHITQNNLTEKLDSNIEDIYTIIRPFAELSKIKLSDIVSGMTHVTETYQEDSSFFRKVDPNFTYGDRANWQSHDDVQETLADRIFSKTRSIDIWNNLKQTFSDISPEITLLNVGNGLGQEGYSFLILLNETLNSERKKVKVNIIGYSKNLQNLIHINNSRIPLEIFKENIRESGERIQAYFKIKGEYAKFNFSLLQNLQASISPVYTDLETPQGRQLIENQKGDYVFFCNIFHHLNPKHQDKALDSVRRSVKPNGYLISDKCEKGIEGKIPNNDTYRILNDIEDTWRFNAPMNASIESGKRGGTLVNEICSGPYEILRQQILSLRTSAKESKQIDFLRVLHQVQSHLSTNQQSVYFGAGQLVDKINTYLLK